MKRFVLAVLTLSLSCAAFAAAPTIDVIVARNLGSRNGTESFVTSSRACKVIVDTATGGQDFWLKILTAAGTTNVLFPADGWVLDQAPPAVIFYFDSSGTSFVKFSYHPSTLKFTSAETHFAPPGSICVLQN